MTWDKDSVKNLRSALKLTQNEFADLLGCRQQTVSEWEQGFYTPANAYGKLLTQLKTQSLGGFIIPQSAKPLEIFQEFKPFDPAVD